VRERDGAFSSFDELLDVAGMSQSRLDRAQPYLHI
jgi:DNA uptake protein ComE-like DNA-binding protein